MSNSVVKHCEVCGVQIHRGNRSMKCASCTKREVDSYPYPVSSPSTNDSCSFCKETHCVIHQAHFFPCIGRKMFVDLRVDMDFNQIDFEYGLLDEDPSKTMAEWSSYAIDMNYCPVCGKKLEKTPYM